MSQPYHLTTPKSWNATQKDLDKEFKMWGVTDWVTNYPKGARYEGKTQSEDERTVTLDYVKDGKPVHLVMGKQKRAIDNIRVLYLAINAMRLQDARGLTETITSALLQIGAGAPVIDPYAVLQVAPTMDIEDIEAVYKIKAKRVHTDGTNPDPEAFKRFTQAIEMIRAKKRNA